MAETLTVPAPGKSGRRPGQRNAGSFGAWLASASVGDIFWSDREMKSITSSAGQVGRKVTMKRYFAVNDQCDAVALVRVEVIG
jgi:hypothetical protein